MADRIIKVSVMLNCSITDAFSYFSENQHLESWLTQKADVEMTEGGKYQLYWTPDDPDVTNNSTHGCTVLAVDAPNFFNIEWRGNAEQKHFMNQVSPLTNVTVLFSVVEESKTKVTLIHTGWRDDEDWENARQYFINAWGGAFQGLEKLVNG